MKVFKYILICLFFGLSALAQKSKNSNDLDIKSKKIVNDTIDTLAPAKAAFYSAILPGLGQAYNKKYWKIPIVYAALGTGIYIIIDNNNKYDNFRTEYKNRVQGVNNPNDVTFSKLSDESILRGQRFYQRNRDLAILVTGALYILNIIDANVDAHLMQFNVSDKLSFQPKIQPNSLNYRLDYVVSLSYNF